MNQAIDTLLYISGLKWIENDKEIHIGYKRNERKKYNILFEKSKSINTVNLYNEKIEVFSSSRLVSKVKDDTLCLYDIPNTIKLYLEQILINPRKPAIDILSIHFRKIVTKFLLKRKTIVPIIQPLPYGENSILFMSHDVDLLRFSKFTNIFKFHNDTCLNDILAMIDITRDRYWNFAKILEWEQERKIKSTFFFITKRKDKYARRYSLDEARGTIEYLKNNHSEIGLHLSDEKILNSRFVNREKSILEDYAGEVIGMRKHYLTENFYEYINNVSFSSIHYDSTAGFRNNIGYAIGTSYPIWYNDILEIPLSLMDSAYMHLAIEQSYENLLYYFEKSGGIFSILYHNHSFSEKSFPGWLNTLEFIINSYCKKSKISLNGKEIYLWRKQIDNIGIDIKDDKIKLKTKHIYSELPIRIDIYHQKEMRSVLIKPKEYENEKYI